VDVVSAEKKSADATTKVKVNKTPEETLEEKQTKKDEL